MSLTPFHIQALSSEGLILEVSEVCKPLYLSITLILQGFCRHNKICIRNKLAADRVTGWEGLFYVNLGMYLGLLAFFCSFLVLLLFL